MMVRQWYRTWKRDEQTTDIDILLTARYYCQSGTGSGPVSRGPRSREQDRVRTRGGWSSLSAAVTSGGRRWQRLIGPGSRSQPRYESSLWAKGKHSKRQRRIICAVHSAAGTWKAGARIWWRPLLTTIRLDSRVSFASSSCSILPLVLSSMEFLPAQFFLFFSLSFFIYYFFDEAVRRLLHCWLALRDFPLFQLLFSSLRTFFLLVCFSWVFLNLFIESECERHTDTHRYKFRWDWRISVFYTDR